MRSLTRKPRYGPAEPARWTLFFGGLCVIAFFVAPGLAKVTGPLAVLYLVIGLGAWQEIKAFAVDLAGLSLGSVVEVPVAELNDWYFTRGEGDPVGLFTVKAVQEAQNRFRSDEKTQ